MSDDGFKGRKPDLELSVKLKGGSSTCRNAGRAWMNADGSISIQLNPGIHLSWNDGCHISLFPIERRPKKPTDDEAPL